MDAFETIHTNTNTKQKNKREIAFGMYYSVDCAENLARKVSDTKMTKDDLRECS